MEGYEAFVQSDKVVNEPLVLGDADVALEVREGSLAVLDVKLFEVFLHLWLRVLVVGGESSFVKVDIGADGVDLKCPEHDCEDVRQILCELTRNPPHDQLQEFNALLHKPILSFLIRSAQNVIDGRPHLFEQFF